jgi:hypothetical protein
MSASPETWLWFFSCIFYKRTYTQTRTHTHTHICPIPPPNLKPPNWGVSRNTYICTSHGLSNTRTPLSISTTRRPAKSASQSTAQHSPTICPLNSGCLQDCPSFVSTFADTINGTQRFSIRSTGRISMPAPSPCHFLKGFSSSNGSTTCSHSKSSNTDTNKAQHCSARRHAGHPRTGTTSYVAHTRRDLLFGGNASLTSQKI